MTSVDRISSLNVDADVFSPLSKVKMEAWRLEVDRKTGTEQKLVYSKLVQQKLDFNVKSVEYCRFCKNNGEKEEVYLSHKTKESSGNVQCPVLRNYTCPK